MNLSRSQERIRVNLPLPGVFAELSYQLIEYLFSFSHEPAVCQAQRVYREGKKQYLALRSYSLVGREGKFIINVIRKRAIITHLMQK